MRTVPTRCPFTFDRKRGPGPWPWYGGYLQDSPAADVQREAGALQVSQSNNRGQIGFSPARLPPCTRTAAQTQSALVGYERSCWWPAFPEVQVQEKKADLDNTAMENRAMASEPAAARRPSGPRSLGRWRKCHLAVPGQAEAVTRPYDGLDYLWPALAVPEFAAEVFHMAVYDPLVTLPFVAPS